MHQLNQLKLKPGLRTFYAIWQGNKSGLFCSLWGLHRVAESSESTVTRSQAVATIADRHTADYLLISVCCYENSNSTTPAVFKILGPKPIGVTRHNRSHDHLIPHRPFPICFFRQFLGKRTI